MLCKEPPEIVIRGPVDPILFQNNVSIHVRFMYCCFDTIRKCYKPSYEKSDSYGDFIIEGSRCSIFRTIHYSEYTVQHYLKEI